MSLAETIQKRIQELVDKKHITVNKLLMECGINKSLIADLKSKGSIPSADKLQRIADYFNVSTDYLLGRTGNPSPIGEVSAAQVSGHGDYSDLPEEAIEKLKAYEADLRKIYKKE